jgi:hypothetical protein
MVAKGRFVESEMRKPIEAWRDRAPKQDPDVRCCWICGAPGGNGFTTALRLAGYRMAPGQVGYAHADHRFSTLYSCVAHLQSVLNLADLFFVRRWSPVTVRETRWLPGGSGRLHAPPCGRSRISLLLLYVL